MMTMEQFIDFEKATERCGMPCIADGHCPYADDWNEENICKEMCGCECDISVDENGIATTEDWDVIEDWLFLCGTGCYVENDKNGRNIERTDMCGGKYLMSENGYVCGQTDSVEDAINFLKGACCC